jgi:vacuolar-type H+-ATPase subunit D/Vma8
MKQYIIDKEDLDWLKDVNILLKSKKYERLIQKIYSHLFDVKKISTSLEKRKKEAYENSNTPFFDNKNYWEGYGDGLQRALEELHSKEK